MSQKQRLQELLQKFKEWSEENGDEELDEHIAAFELEIVLIDESQADSDGGNHPGGPPPHGKP